MTRPATKFKPAPKRAANLVAARPRVPVWLLAALLVLVTMALYWPATSHDFINYDDNVYVTLNPHVQNGLTFENLLWVFLKPDVVFGYYHPLTLLSLMLDCQLFGLKPWGHHLTSMLLHTLNTLLVFLLLRRLTGAIWRSILVAALFGLHPLNVESVAWVAERKGVLSTCLGLLSLLFYARYAQSKVLHHKLPILYYALALLFYALGLMSKPMLVTWPFVLLLLDYWPLDRFKTEIVRRLVTEKIPFIALAVATCVLTFLLMVHVGNVATFEDVSLVARVGNVLISYCRYLGKLFWPTDLAVFYPYPGQWPMGKVLLAGGLLVGISVVLWVQRRRYPYLLMGWLWFSGTLLPVIGLVKNGEFAMADRYAYVPSLGVLILAIWGAYDLIKTRQHHIVALAVAGSAAIVLCIALTWRQLGYWQDSATLFRHALEVTENNRIAHRQLGIALLKKGQTDEAISHYYEAIRLQPGFSEDHYNLGVALNKQGQTDEGIRQYQEALRLAPDYADARYNLGIAFGLQRRTDEAIRQFQEVIRLKPDNAEAHYNLGVGLHLKGQADESIQQYQEAIRLKPDYAEAHYNLGTVLGRKGRTDEAIHHLQEAIRLKPDYVEAQNNLAHALKIKNAPAGR